jgi:hypothetical protein
VLPATGFSTSNADGRVKVRFEESGMSAREPISVPGLLHKTALEYPNYPALVSKGEDGQWKEITFKYEPQALITIDSVICNPNFVDLL